MRVKKSEIGPDFSSDVLTNCNSYLNIDDLIIYIKIKMLIDL